MNLTFQLFAMRSSLISEPLQAMQLTVVCSVESVSGLTGYSETPMMPHHLGMTSLAFFETPEGQALKVKAQAHLLNSIARLNQSLEVTA